MIEENGTVVKVYANQVEIEMSRQGACSHCELSAGCGTGAIGRLLGHRSKPIIIQSDRDLNIGDEVVLGLP